MLINVFQNVNFKQLPSYYYNPNLNKTQKQFPFTHLVDPKKSKLCSSVPHFLPLKKSFEYPFQFFCWFSSQISCVVKWCTRDYHVCRRFPGPLRAVLCPLLQNSDPATPAAHISAHSCYRRHIWYAWCKPHELCYNFA